MLRTSLARAAGPILRCRATALPRALTPTINPLLSCRPATISLARFGSGRAEEPPPTAEEATAEAKPQPPEAGMLYEGAKNKIVKSLKTVSIANLGFAVASAPLLQYITAASGNSGKGVAMSGLLLFFGGGNLSTR